MDDLGPWSGARSRVRWRPAAELAAVLLLLCCGAGVAGFLFAGLALAARLP